eukprot:1160645-Pelagomonas_calceolata.AAC.3
MQQCMAALSSEHKRMHRAQHMTKMTIHLCSTPGAETIFTCIPYAEDAADAEGQKYPCHRHSLSLYRHQSSHASLLQKTQQLLTARASAAGQPKLILVTGTHCLCSGHKGLHVLA